MPDSKILLLASDAMRIKCYASRQRLLKVPDARDHYHYKTTAFDFLHFEIC